MIGGTHVHDMANRVSLDFAVRVKSDAIALRRRANNLLGGRDGTAPEVSSVGSDESGSEPYSVWLQRIGAEVMEARVGIREGVLEFEAAKSLRELLLAQWANDRADEFEIVRHEPFRIAQPLHFCSRRGERM